jgi:aspartate aminotransferase
MSAVTESVELVERRERSRSIPPSALHEIHSLVADRAGDTIALHVGEPHIRMPEAAAEAFARAIRDGHTSYTDAPGLPELRQALAERLAANGAPSPDLIFVTPGSCQAIAAVLQSVAIDGGVALLPEVHWPMHLQQVILAGLKPRFFPIQGGTGSIEAALEAAYDPSVGVVIINSPANPSGFVFDRATIARIHGWAVRHNVWVLSDEAYEDFVYEGEQSATAALEAELPAADRRVFSVHTFSKGYSMTGCRLGYVATPSAERAGLLRRVQEATLVAPSTPVQYAGIAALRDTTHLAAHHAYVRGTRDEILPALEERRLLWSMPAGGWYALLDLSAHTPDTHRFCLDLLRDTGVALAPGHCFLPAGHAFGRRLARLTLCAERESSLEGVRRLLGYLER